MEPVPVPARLAAHGWSMTTRSVNPAFPCQYVARDGVELERRSLLTGDVDRQWRLYLVDDATGLQWVGFGDGVLPFWADDVAATPCGPFGSLREAVSALTGVEL